VVGYRFIVVSSQSSGLKLNLSVLFTTFTRMLLSQATTQDSVTSVIRQLNISMLQCKN